jgi:hypothetical protein
MTAAFHDATHEALEADAARDGYVSGTCNIGPVEIARRRMVGHLGLLITLLGFLALVSIQVNALWRLVLFVPAAASASGYLQAMLHFCAGFGSRGVYNFGPLGRQERIADPDALARDRSMSGRIGLGSAAIGAVVAIAAVLVRF